MADAASLARARAALLRDLRGQGICDRRVLEALNRVPREAFVNSNVLDLAYENRALPIACGQTISQPYIVGLMTQSLELDGTQRVLEIGTGSGYQAAVLAQLANEVFTIERFEELSANARQMLKRLGINNVTFRVGDGNQGWEEEAPFDRIIVTAAASVLPPRLVEQLAEGGILVAPIGDDGAQVLYSYHKHDGMLRPEYLCDCRFVPLVDGSAPNRVEAD